MYSRTKLYYKDGLQVFDACHLDTTIWYRGVHITKKSRKAFRCICGCTISAGSSYLTVSMLAGSGRSDSIVDFALCDTHQRETESLLGRVISTDVDTVDIIKVWDKILQSENGNIKPEIQIKALVQSPTPDSQITLCSFSWEIRSESCAIKTVDKTLRDEGRTGVPMDIVPFFIGQQLVEGQEQTLQFSILDMTAYCNVSRKQGHHRLSLVPLKQKLIQLGIQVGDLLFFERDFVVANRFNISILNQENEVLIQTDSSTVSPGAERIAYAIVRRGQDIFRERVQRAYGNRCCLSGIEDTAPSILIASHIKPWRLATPIEKTDVFNGLLLAPHYDKLFDQGLISFSDDGKLLFSKKLTKHVVQAWGLENKALRIVHPQSVPYLNFHRNYFGF